MATNDRLTKAQRRDEARRKAAELRAKEERERRRNKIIGLSLLGIAIAVAIVGIGAAVKQNRDASKADSALPSQQLVADNKAKITVPAGSDIDLLGIPVSKQGTGTRAADGVVVDVYLDFICPWCGRFEQQQGPEIARLLDPKTGFDDVTVVYHMVANMDKASQGTNYSTRAANAATVVADKDPEHFVAFMTKLFATQPHENTPGHSDQRLAEIAQSVGVPKAVTDQFTATVQFGDKTVRTFVPWTAALTYRQIEHSTPRIVIDGTDWDGWTQESIYDAVQVARGVTPPDDQTPAEEPKE